MLVDIELQNRIPTNPILFPKPVRVKTGVYDNCGFNFHNWIPKNIEYDDYFGIQMRKLIKQHGGGNFEEMCGRLNSYGICDSIEDFMNLFGEMLKRSTCKYVVGFTKVEKKDQEHWGGWRWHKWGPYIGKQKPTTEYLYDEPLVEVVYTYHIYKIKGEKINGNSNDIK